MSISHRTNRLKLVGQPSVEQLQNGRYRLTVTCSTINSREDWYSVNKNRILPDFGSLQSAEMSIDGLAPREGEAYTDMRLTKVESGNRSGMGAVGDYNVELTYETLGSAFVQVKDDTTDYELNGLRRVTRTSIAEAGIDYAKTVGTSFIDHQINNETAVRCYLASYSVDDTDSFRQVQEVYVEAGTLSETLDNVGSQKAKVIETIGADPDTPTDYSLASTQESDFEGFQTNRFTFLKDNVELSRSEDLVGSQKAIVTEVFNPSANPTESGYSLARTEVSDVDGIPTKRFTFLKPSVLSRVIQRNNNGRLIIETVEAFDEVPTAETFGAVQIGTDISNVEGIQTKRFTFAKGDGQIFISESAGPNNIPGTTQRTIRSLGAELVPDGVLIDSQDIVRDGYIEYIRTTLDGTIEGVKTVYADVATVEVPGTVSCTTQAVSEGSVSGTIAITNSTPRRQKQVETQVTVEITRTPPTTADRAYDLGAISCSVTSVQTKLQSGDGSVATAVDGSTTLSRVGFQKSFASSASIQHYIGSYLTSSSSSGSVSYQSSEQPYLSAPNAISVQSAFSSASSSCTGTGATSATGYSEVGVISRTVNVVLTALDGTTYYQVVTEETL